jgi:hypothetical protein
MSLWIPLFAAILIAQPLHALESKTGKSESKTGKSESKTGKSESKTGKSESKTGKSESKLHGIQIAMLLKKTQNLRTGMSYDTTLQELGFRPHHNKISRLDECTKYAYFIEESSAHVKILRLKFKNKMLRLKFKNDGQGWVLSGWDTKGHKIRNVPSPHRTCSAPAMLRKLGLIDRLRSSV